MKRKKKQQPKLQRAASLPQDAVVIHEDPQGRLTVYLCNNGAIYATRQEKATYRVLKGDHDA